MGCPFEGLPLREHALSGWALLRRGAATRWPVEQQGSRGPVLRDQRIPCHVGIASTFAASLPAYTLEIRHRSPRCCAELGCSRGTTARAGQTSAGAGKQTIRRCVGRRELEPGSAGTLGGGFRGEEPDPQPIAPAISRSARPIQAARRARQEALLRPSEAPLARPKEKKAVAAPPLESIPVETSTSQCPPLSGPTRRNIPACFSLLRACHSRTWPRQPLRL